MKTCLFFLFSTALFAQSVSLTPVAVPTAVYTPAPTLTPIPAHAINYIYLQPIAGGHFEIVNVNGTVLNTLNSVSKSAAIAEAYSIFGYGAILMVFKDDGQPGYVLVGGRVQ